MIQLEKYKGSSSRHICPKCQQRGVFVRYELDGNYIADDVGRCNRESSCGYHKKPSEYFAENPQFAHLLVKTRAAAAPPKPAQFDYIPFDCFKATLGNYEQNAFVRFLHDLFPDALDLVQAVLERYFVGTFEDYTCFPSIDSQNRICRAKLIRFNPITGKRLKGVADTSSLPAKLKLKENFQYKQIFFGEHLLLKYPDKPAAIVEAEKTAIICSLCLPQFIWLATGSKQWLKANRLQRLGTRRIILYPDADGYELWQKVASEALWQGVAAAVSSLIENHATEQQKANGFDLADYLIKQQAEINRTNNKIDFYNSAVDAVLSDEALLDQFEIILEEQKAIAMLTGGASERAADAMVCSPTNLTQIILSLQ
jgi:hypothetical protein